MEYLQSPLNFIQIFALFYYISTHMKFNSSAGRQTVNLNIWLKANGRCEYRISGKWIIPGRVGQHESN